MSLGIGFASSRLASCSIHRASSIMAADDQLMEMERYTQMMSRKMDGHVFGEMDQDAGSTPVLEYLINGGQDQICR